MIGKMLATLALVVIGLGTYLYFYLGFFLPVEIMVGERGPFHLVYKNHTGAYHQIGSVVQEVEAWAKQNSIRCELTFGEYIDDPAAQDQDRLRSRGGCALTLKPQADMPEGLNYEERPSRRYVIGVFEGSPSIGPFKVYPKIQDFIQEQRLKSTGPVIETYLIRGEKVTTEFLFPLD